MSESELQQWVEEDVAILAEENGDEEEEEEEYNQEVVEEEVDEEEDMEVSSFSAVAPASDFARQRIRLNQNAEQPSVGQRVTMHRIVGPGLRIQIQTQVPRGRGTGRGGRGVVRLQRMTPFHLHQQQHHVNIATNGSSIRPPDAQPLPLADAEQDFLPYEQERVAQLAEDLKCTICCEFLDDPLGCGYCPSRFCRACWARHLESSPTCPTCRHEVDYEDLQPDQALSERINESLSDLCCRYQGCERHFQCLADIKQHEEQCPFVKVRCRYAPTGCVWKGVRADVTHHQQADCAFARIDPFITDYLHTRRTFNNQITPIRGQMAAMNQMQSHFGQSISLVSTKCRANPLHVLEFVISCVSSPVNCLLCKDMVWSAMISNSDARTQVFHTLGLVPVVTIIFRCTIRALELFAFKHFTHILSESARLTAIPFWIPFLIAVQGYFTLYLCGLNADSVDKFMSYFSNKPIQFQDVLAASFIIFFALVAAEMGPSNGRKIKLLCIYLASLLFPSFIMEFSSQARRPDPNRNSAPLSLQIAFHGPIMKPMLFGLKIGYYIGARGVVTTLDAVLFGEYLSRGKLNPVLTKYNCIVPAEMWFRKIPTHAIVAWFVARLSYVTYQSMSMTSQHYLPLLQWIKTFVWLMPMLAFSNRRIFLMVKMGTTYGHRWHKLAASRLHQHMQNECMPRGLFNLFAFVIVWGTIYIIA